MNRRFLDELKVIRWASLALFVSIAFVVSVALVYFLQFIDLPEDQVRAAAPATFVLVLIITALFVIGYIVIRYVTVIRPVSRINTSLEKIAAGDFSERLHLDGAYGNFALLADHINRMTEELASSALMKTDFISNVSHELKTPLAVIHNYGTLLEADNITEAERKEYAAAVMGASGRMSELITNILRLNRLENQKLEAHKEEYDLSAQLSECLLGFESIWEEKEIDLDVDIADDVKICSDAELLGLVWNNLLSNAFKFTEAGGTVGVSLYTEEDHAVVKVSDTGCGMNEDTGRHIFEKFYQGDTSRAAQGNGLGLSLVKRVIDLTGGEISVKSKVGEGSTFTVRIRKDIADE